MKYILILIKTQFLQEKQCNLYEKLILLKGTLIKMQIL